MDKRIRIFAALIFLAIGGGLIYSSAGEAMSVGADSLIGSADSSFTTIILAVGILLVLAGVLAALFIFSPSNGGRSERS